MLADAELPAIATDPNEFIDDWINTLDSENTVPWIPAGAPICIIFLSFTLCILSRHIPSFLTRHITTIPEDTASAIIVARADPATPIPQYTTKTIFNNALITPAIVR